MRRALVRRCVLQRKVYRQLHKCRMAEKSPKPLLLLHEAGVESESFLIPCVIKLTLYNWIWCGCVRMLCVRMLCVRMLCVRMVCVRMVCVRPCVYVCFLFFIPPEYDFIYSTMIITVTGVSRHSNPRPPSKLAKIGKIGSKCQLLSVLVRVLVSSETHNDPFNRSWSTPEAKYAPPAPLKPKEAAMRTECCTF